jgi:DNA-binding PadR family transcriptional regulator
MASDDLQKYLPLTEATFAILAVLDEPLHGYAVMQKVEQLSQGIIKIGPGTLYGAFAILEKEKLIRMVAEDERRKSYLLTEKGRRVAFLHMKRLDILRHIGRPFIGLE